MCEHDDCNCLAHSNKTVRRHLSPFEGDISIKSSVTTSPKSIPVYHCCTGHLGTLTWGKVTEYGLHHLYDISLENAICYPYLQFTENRYVAESSKLKCTNFVFFIKQDFGIIIFEHYRKLFRHLFLTVTCVSLVVSRCKKNPVILSSYLID